MWVSEDLAVNLRAVQMFVKELDESSGDYKGMAAKKPHFDHSDEKRAEFVDDVMIDNDPISQSGL